MLTVLRKLDPDCSFTSAGKQNALEKFLPVSINQCRVATGRSAIYHLISRLNFKPSESVILPAYIAEGVLQPFHAANIQTYFYRLDHQLLPDLIDIKRLLQAHNVKLTVMFHPFGHVAPLKELHFHCKNSGSLLLEDCALSMFSTDEHRRPVGAGADFSLYSLNKFLPVLDGSIILNHRSEFDVSIEADAYDALDPSALKAYERHLHLNYKYSTAESAEEGSRFLQETGHAYEEYYSHINGNLKIRSQSRISRSIENATNIEQLVRRRTEIGNRIFLNVNSKKVKFLQTFDDTVVPFAITILVDGIEREDAKERLLAKGVLASTLIDKWDFLPENSEHDFVHERHFLKNHLLIPSSESMTDADVIKITEALNSL